MDRRVKTRTRQGAVGMALAVVTLLAVSPVGCRREPAAPMARFVERGPDVVRDTTTGFEWTRRDHPQALPWDEADRYCRARAGGDWRIPELGELETLYDPAHDTPCGERRCRVDAAITLGGPYVWTATARGIGTRFYLDVAHGNALSPTVTPELVRRVLCVRGAGSGMPPRAPIPSASSAP